MKTICAQDRTCTPKRNKEELLVHLFSLTGHISKYLMDKVFRGQGDEKYKL